MAEVALKHEYVGIGETVNCIARKTIFIFLYWKEAS